MLLNLLAFAALMVLMEAAVLEYIGPQMRGIGVADEAFYAYSLEYPHYLDCCSPGFQQDLGFFLYGYPFLAIFGHSIATPSYMTLSAILLTSMAIFATLLRYRMRIGGLLAAALYLFNPRVYAYSTSVYPDIFIGLLLSLSIMVLVIAKMRQGRNLHVLS